MNKSPIQVLLVEDSPVVLVILKRILASSPDIFVVGTARNGKEALELIPKLQPHVICTDIHMPQMNGLEFTEEVMMKFPRPILAISASVHPEDTQTIFRMLEAGAVDVFPKPRAQSVEDYESFKQELIGKIKILSGVTVFTRHRRNRKAEGQGCSCDGEIQNSKYPSGTPPAYKIQNSASSSRRNCVPPVVPSHQSQGNCVEPVVKSHHSPVPTPNRIFYPKSKIVAIGASTGGPQALHAILSQLPSNLPIPVVSIQHISEGFLQGLVDWLASECQLPVKIAKFGDIPQPGTIYFPPEGRHLEFDAQGRFVCSSSPPVSGHRPSVTVTFKSVAKYYGAAAVGILLTGMGRDGADGMLAIAQAGGITIAQNQASCVVFGMPKEAIALGAAQYILPVNQIAFTLIQKLKINS